MSRSTKAVLLLAAAMIAIYVIHMTGLMPIHT